VHQYDACGTANVVGPYVSNDGGLTEDYISTFRIDTTVASYLQASVADGAGCCEQCQITTGVSLFPNVLSFPLERQFEL
jgi:hypothetical protein